MKYSLVKIENLNYLSRSILLLIAIFWSVSATASNNYSVSLFACNGYEPISRLYWKIEGEIANDANPIKSLDDSYIYRVSLTNSARTVTRSAIGRKTTKSFIFSFFKNDDARSIKNTEGIFTVENTDMFPTSTRFAAHGWLASNPQVSQTAIDFICTLN